MVLQNLRCMARVIGSIINGYLQVSVRDIVLTGALPRTWRQINGHVVSTELPLFQLLILLCIAEMPILTECLFYVQGTFSIITEPLGIRQVIYRSSCARALWMCITKLLSSAVGNNSGVDAGLRTFSMIHLKIRQRLLQFMNSPDLKEIMGSLERGVHSGYAEKVTAGDVDLEL